MKFKKKKVLGTSSPHFKMQAYSSAHTVILSIFMMHINWAFFSVHNDKHIDRVLYYNLFNIGQWDLYVCLFFCI